MKLEVRSYNCLPCSAEVFTINGRDAKLDDFGHYEYGYSDDEDEWGVCSERYFRGYQYFKNTETAKKYNLTREEYDEVVSELEDKFAVGTCGWCV